MFKDIVEHLQRGNPPCMHFGNISLGIEPMEGFMVTMQIGNDALTILGFVYVYINRERQEKYIFIFYL